MFFLEFLENFQNTYVKEQSYFHVVGALEEMDRLLKDLIRSALSLEIHNICKFNLLSSSLGLQFGLLILKKHQKLYYHYFPPDVPE